MLFTQQIVQPAANNQHLMVSVSQVPQRLASTPAGSRQFIFISVLCNGFITVTLLSFWGREAHIVAIILLNISCLRAQSIHCWIKNGQPIPARFWNVWAQKLIDIYYILIMPEKNQYRINSFEWISQILQTLGSFSLGILKFCIKLIKCVSLSSVDWIWMPFTDVSN